MMTHAIRGLALCVMMAFAWDGVATGIESVSITEKSRSLEISWSTPTPLDSVVQVGDRTVADDGLTTEHLLVVTGLAADTEYPVSIRSLKSPSSQHATVSRTRKTNALLIDRFGKPFVAALEEAFGLIDEEALPPAASRAIALNELIAARRNLAAADRQLAECDEHIAKITALKTFLVQGTANLPPELQSELNDTMALVPEISTQDLTALLSIKVSEQLGQLTALRAEILSQRGDIAKQAATLGGALGISGTH